MLPAWRLWLFLLIVSASSSSFADWAACPSPTSFSLGTRTKVSCLSQYSAVDNRDYLCSLAVGTGTGACISYTSEQSVACYTVGVVVKTGHEIGCSTNCNIITPTIDDDIYNTGTKQCACPSGSSRFKHPFMDPGIVEDCEVSCPSGTVPSATDPKLCVCPSGTVADLTAGQCVSTCTAPQIANPVTGQCQDPCTEIEEANPFTGQCQVKCSTRASSAGSFPMEYNTASVPVCLSGCDIVKTGGHVILASGSALGDFTFSGVPCDSTLPSGEPCTDCGTNEDMTCPEGQAYATWQGVSGCYPIVDYNPPAPPAPTETEETTTSNTTTTENPDGSTTTTTTTTSNTTTSGGSSGTGTTTTTTTTTTNPDGSVTTTETSETTEETLNTGGLPDGSGGAESFWQSGYPDGLGGVWQSHQSSLINSPMAQWLNSWSFANSGTCPTFSFAFDLGSMGNFGSAAIPSDLLCYVFPIIRAIVLLSSLLLARRLIFGG